MIQVVRLALRHFELVQDLSVLPPGIVLAWTRCLLRPNLEWPSPIREELLAVSLAYLRHELVHVDRGHSCLGIKLLVAVVGRRASALCAEWAHRLPSHAVVELTFVIAIVCAA